MKEKELFLSTEMVAADERTDFWREIIKPMFESTQLPEDKGMPLQGSIRSYAVNSLLIGATSFSRQQYKRDQRMISGGGIDHYLVEVLETGRVAGNYNGLCITANPGDITILDLGQIMESQVENGSRITAAILRTDLEKAVGWRNLHGTVLRAGLPVTKLLMDYMIGLLAVAGDLSTSQSAATQEAMITLLAAGLNGHEGPSHQERAALSVILRQRVLDYIDRHISDPALSPELLTLRFKVSRSHLYRTFEADGGVASIIRDKRLDLAYRALMTNSSRVLSITEIAYNCGFSNSTQFIRGFRTRFGATAKEIRRESSEFLPKHTGTFHLQTHFVQQIPAKNSAIILSSDI